VPCRGAEIEDSEIGNRKSGIGNLSDAKRIAIFRLSALGDVVNTLPALSALRRARPDAHITWVVEAASAGVLDGHPMLDEVLVSGRKRWQGAFKRLRGAWRAAREFCGFCALLRRKRFDAVIDFQGNLRSAVGTWLTRAPMRVGPGRGAGRERSHWFYSVRLPLPEGPMHRVERGLALLRALGIETADAKPVIPVSEADKAKVDAFLVSVGLATATREPPPPCHSEPVEEPLKGEGRGHAVSPGIGADSSERCFASLSMTGGGAQGGGFALIHAGTSPFGQYKQWPAERWAEVAKRLGAEFGLRVAFTRGPSQSESEAAEAMAACVNAVGGVSPIVGGVSPVVGGVSPRRGSRDGDVPPTMARDTEVPPTALAAPVFSLRELGELCRRCRVFLSVDTGPMHLASAVGAPVVALFGPKDPRVYGPYFGPRAIVEKPLDCRPCRKRSCDDPRCMLAITPDDVLAATKELLG